MPHRWERAQLHELICQRGNAREQDQEQQNKGRAVVAFGARPTAARTSITDCAQKKENVKDGKWSVLQEQNTARTAARLPVCATLGCYLGYDAEDIPVPFIAVSVVRALELLVRTSVVLEHEARGKHAKRSPHQHSISPHVFFQPLYGHLLALGDATDHKPSLQHNNKQGG